MRLETFLREKKVDQKLIELMLFFSGSAKKIKGEFLGNQNISDTKNSYGEVQMELDKKADQILVVGLMENGLARYVATEENKDIIEIKSPKNNFGVVIDPLDGSSLIDVNLAVGTIIGIYPGTVLDMGKNMLAAMYILYGPLTTLTLTVGSGNGVHDFVMDEYGEFYLTQENVRIPDGKIYAPGALKKDYLPGHAAFIESLEKDGYKLRYSGSFVADVHQILHKGGIFTYPGFKGKEKGKLRLLFEANPMGKIITEAGGAASNGIIDILSTMPVTVNDTTPIYIGGKSEIELIRSSFDLFDV
jgi:fructose-1,6-bisphosphatase I